MKRSEELEGAKSGKTVRFMNNNNNNIEKQQQSAQLYNAAPQQQQHNIHPVHGMVQQLVPHLPGLDKDKVYVISGPFPNFDPVSGPSQLLMATPVSAGATIIAVPSGPPPPPGPGQHPQCSAPVNKQDQQQQQQQQQPGSPGHVFHPPNPQMLHWDNHHPTGHIVPLRQPNPPVYYNVPAANTSVPSVHSSGTSSGLQSPSSSEGCCMSDSSSDHSDQTQENTAPPPDHKMMFHPGHYPPVPLHIPCLEPPQYCHLRGQDQFGQPVFIPQHPHPHGYFEMIQPQRVNQQVCM